MPVAFELFFDSRAEAAVRGVWAALAEAGIPMLLEGIGSRPHVSLAVCDALDAERVRSQLEAFAARERPVTLSFQSVGTFPTAEGAVFLAPAITGRLVQLHQRFHRALPLWGVGSSSYYLPGRWVPHCTVATDLPAGQVGASALRATGPCAQIPPATPPQPCPLSGGLRERSPSRGAYAGSRSKTAAAARCGHRARACSWAPWGTEGTAPARTPRARDLGELARAGGVVGKGGGLARDYAEGPVTA